MISYHLKTTRILNSPVICLYPASPKSATMSSSAQSFLILKNDDKSMRVRSTKEDVPESHHYYKGKLYNAAAMSSLYVVYGTSDFGKADKGSRPGVIIDTTDLKPVGFNVLSVKAFEKNGIVLFEYPNYAGDGINVTESTAEEKLCGNSFIVNAGVWELLLSSGEKLTVEEGKRSQFGPGTHVTSLSDKNIISAKKID